MTTLKNQNLNHSILALFSGQQTNITIPTAYISITGNHYKAMVISQMIYWSNKSTHCTDGWFYKEYAEWFEELMIPERTLRRYFRELEKNGFCEAKVKRVKGITKLHVRPCIDNIFDAISAIISGTAKMADPGTAKMADRIYTEDYNNDYLHNNGDGRKSPSPKKLKDYEKDERFMAFYSIYPKKEKPQEAHKAFKKLDPDDELLQKIIEDVKERSEKHDGWKDRQYIPQPSRYLNSGDYESEIINSDDERKRKEQERLKADKARQEEQARQSQRIADMERENTRNKKQDAQALKKLTEKTKNHVGIKDRLGWK